MKVFNYFNLRTFLVLIISQLSAFLAIHFQIKFNLDLLLFSLAVAFPLVFSIQSAFKRRDRALEYFSLFKAGLFAVQNSFRVSKDLSAEKKEEATEMLIGMADQLFQQLENRITGNLVMNQKMHEIMSFIERNRKEISSRNVLRMIRYLKDITESSTYLISLVRHRTMAGLRFYSLLFINIFPIIQAPILLYRLGPVFPQWVLYPMLALSSFILITMSNFQTLIEFPFDKKGMDNINTNDFKLNDD